MVSSDSSPDLCGAWAPPDVQILYHTHTPHRLMSLYTPNVSDSRRAQNSAHSYTQDNQKSCALLTFSQAHSAGYQCIYISTNFVILHTTLVALKRNSNQSYAQKNHEDPHCG